MRERVPKFGPPSRKWGRLRRWRRTSRSKSAMWAAQAFTLLLKKLRGAGGLGIRPNGRLRESWARASLQKVRERPANRFKKLVRDVSHHLSQGCFKLVKRHFVKSIRASLRACPRPERSWGNRRTVPEAIPKRVVVGISGGSGLRYALDFTYGAATAAGRKRI